MAEFFEMQIKISFFASFLGSGEARCEDWRKAERVHAFSRKEPCAHGKAPVCDGCCASFRDGTMGSRFHRGKEVTPWVFYLNSKVDQLEHYREINSYGQV